MAVNSHGNKLWLRIHMERTCGHELTWKEYVAMNPHGKENVATISHEKKMWP